MIEHNEFHDGWFEGLRVDRDRRVVHIYLSTINKERTTVVLKDVVILEANGFRDGNIVLSVSTRNCEEITRANIADLYHLDAECQPASWEVVLAARIKKERLQMLEIAPSYGGSCTALAGSIEFSRGTSL